MKTINKLILSGAIVAAIFSCNHHEPFEPCFPGSPDGTTNGTNNPIDSTNTNPSDSTIVNPGGGTNPGDSTVVNPGGGTNPGDSTIVNPGDTTIVFPPDSL